MKQEKKKGKAKKVRVVSQNKKIMVTILLTAIMVYVAYAIYLLVKQPTNIFTIEEGKLYQEETVIGYVIRKETVVRGENYKNGMMQIKSEGERAGKEENIFRYYSSNEEALKKKIADLDNKIQEVMLNDTNLFSSDMKLLENQIDEKVSDINQIQDSTKLAEYKKTIGDLVTKKAQIAGDLSPKGSYLNQLIEERKGFESQLNSGAEYVKAPMSGIVSYKVDGLEETLTPDNFSSLSKSYLENLDLKTGKLVATSEESGKIIDNFSCYIVTVSSSKEAKSAEVGKKIKIRLSNNTEISAEITNIIKEEEQDVVLILKIDKQIEELINYRKISFDLIWWDDSGLKVPNQAIVKVDDLDYVVRNRAGYLSKMLVKVKKQGERYSIVEAYSTEDLKKLGFSNEEIAKDKKISLYDEVLLNPKMDMIN
ncbi:MAG: hypothetical protein HFJ33_01325 [Clostridia bacterium]|nr:hypothetical protein [Clostridia bacterium]